jgi:glycosyltransferase involved in cell wall biosynthesis
VKIAVLGNASVIHTQRWAGWFRGRGHAVEVWSLEPGPPGFAAHALPSPPLPGFLRYPLAVPALRRALARFTPDVVDAHYVPNYGLMGALCGRRALSVAAWGSDLLVAGGRDALQRARTRFVLERAALVIADSGNLAAAARGLGASPDKVVALPWGIDVERFKPAPARERGLLLSTRMHEPVYDIPTLIRGVAPLMAARPELRLVLTGAGGETAAIERLAARLLPAERFRFAGRVASEEMADLLARAEVFLSASRSDSTSVSLLEAMASGALPVVTDIEGNREWVSEGVGARLFTPGDPEALTGAVTRALDDPAWAVTARTRNRETILARGDAATNMVRVESLFESIAAGKRPDTAGAEGPVASGAHA